MPHLRNMRVATLFGIPILVHPAWFLLFGLTTLLLATDVYPKALDHGSTPFHILLAALSALLFFASIILHELAHSLVARVYHIPVKSITLFLFGGVAQITREATRPTGELLMALAGPMTSAMLSAALFGIWWASGVGESSALDIVLIWLAAMNGVVAIFNLLPAFPMDGGRVFRSLVWLVTGSYYRATAIAAWAGRGIAWVLIAGGFLAVLGFDPLVFGPSGGAWFVLIGFFLEGAARQSLVHNRLIKALGQHRVSDLMVADPPAIDGQVSVAVLARGVLELNPRVCYFIESDGRLEGILSAYQMRAVPEQLWDTTSAAQAMVPRSRLRATSPERSLMETLLEMETEDLLHMPVVSEGRVIGVIARDRILGVLRQAGVV